MRQAILIFLLLSSLSVFGQSNYAVLGGTVVDPQGELMPGPSWFLPLSILMRFVRQRRIKRAYSRFLACSLATMNYRFKPRDLPPFRSGFVLRSASS